MTPPFEEPPRAPEQRRAAGALLIVSSAIFFLAEFVSAAAWTDPPYSYTHHFISNLGVRGPSEAFGQFMSSPLAWVMNTGFFLFGVTVLAGVAMLRGPAGRRRWALLATALLVAAGGVLLALFPGSGEAADNGTGDYHGLGAFAAIVGGNALAILLGTMHRSVGTSPRTGKALVVLGTTGLLSFAGFTAVVMSDGRTLVGLVERGAVYPYLIGFVCAGAAIWNRSAEGR